MPHTVYGAEAVNTDLSEPKILSTVRNIFSCRTSAQEFVDICNRIQLSPSRLIGFAEASIERSC